jgi:XTP/dITP diphosphohydrolase
MRVVLATSNPGKARETRSILEAAGFSIETLPMWIGEIETGTTYLENARLKASNVLRLTGETVLAEDAGLEIEALHGRPGVQSARFAGPGATPADNNAKLLRLLDDVADDERMARYRIVAVMLQPVGAEYVAEGTLEGRIVNEPRGDGGFGYDPIFVPDGEERTVGEMRQDEKNVFSHRAKALRDLISKL